MMTLDFINWLSHMLLVQSGNLALLTPCVQDEGVDKSDFSEEKYEITESMRLEMEYNSDRAW